MMCITSKYLNPTRSLLYNCICICGGVIYHGWQLSGGCNITITWTICYLQTILQQGYTLKTYFTPVITTYNDFKEQKN